MNLHPRRDTPVPQTQRPRPPHLRQPGFFIPALSCPVHTPLFSHLIPPLFHNGSISCISLPLRHGLSHGTTDTDSLATFSFRHLSTTAPFSAFRCRCGMTFLAAPLLQAFWTALPSCYASTTAAFLAFLCRCGIDFLTDPCYRPSGRHCHPVTLRKVSL